MKNKINKSELVSIVIVTWNGLSWLQKSLPSLETIDYKSIEIILVDNASTDGTVSWVTTHYRNIHVIKLHKNLGFADANNYGYEHAKGKYILFLNNDVEVKRTFLTELIKAVEVDKNIAGAQSTILLLEDHKRYDSIGAFLTPTGFLYHYCFRNQFNKKFQQDISLYTPKGACMLFKKEMLDKILIQGKLFDPNAFSYFEETDMAHRIWLSGKKIVYAHNSVIYHKMGGTSSTMNNAIIQFHSFKNRIASYLKNVSLKKLIPLMFIHTLVVQVYACSSLLKGRFFTFVAIQIAIVWNIFHIFDTYKKRHIIQTQIRKVPDESFWKEITKYPPFAYYSMQMRGLPFVEDM